MSSRSPGTSDRDLNRVVRSWLDEGVTAFPDPLLDSVLAQLPANPQRRSRLRAWPAGGMLTVNKFVAAGLGVAAVVVLLIIGTNLLGGSPAPGGDPSPSVAPSEAPSQAEPSVAAGLPEGPHLFVDPAAVGEVGAAITVTIPAPGWMGEEAGGVVIKNDNAEAPDGAGMIVFQGELYVYSDPCQWLGTDSLATTVDELVAALSAQALRDATDPVDIEVDGYTGQSITLHVPEDADLADCDQSTFGTWTVGAGLEPYRYNQDPGQIDELWILDVDGVPAIINLGYYPGTPAEVVEELRSMVASATFEPQ